MKCLYWNVLLYSTQISYQLKSSEWVEMLDPPKFKMAYFIWKFSKFSEWNLNSKECFIFGGHHFLKGTEYCCKWLLYSSFTIKNGQSSSYPFVFKWCLSKIRDKYCKYNFDVAADCWGACFVLHRQFNKCVVSHFFFKEKAIKHLPQLQPCSKLCTGGRSERLLSPLPLSIIHFAGRHIKKVFCVCCIQEKNFFFFCATWGCLSRIVVLILHCQSLDPVCMMQHEPEV